MSNAIKIYLVTRSASSSVSVALKVFAFVFSVFLCSAVTFANWQLTAITDNDVEDRIVRISPNSGNLVWMDQTNSILKFWDGSSIHLIESGVFGGYTVDHDSVIYSHWGTTGNYDLYRWENNVSSLLTTYAKSDSYPVMFNDSYGWMRDYGPIGNTNWDIMFFDGITEHRLTDSSASEQGLAIGSGNLFWLNTGDHRVYRYDGSSTFPISGINDYVSDSIVQDAWNDHAVWIALYGLPGDDREIVYYDGSSAHRLTDNAVDDFYPRIHGSRIVWQGHGGIDGGTDYEIFLYDAGTISQLTENDMNDEYPDVSESLVTWRQVVSMSPYDIATIVYDGISTTRITPPEYTVTNNYLYEQTVVLVLDDGNDNEIFTASWEPDPTVTPTQTPTAPPPPIPSTNQWGILILGGLLGMILILTTSSRQWKLFRFLILIPIITSPGAILAQSINWDVECADCPPFFAGIGSNILQIDNNGTPNIAIGGDYLYLITHDGVQWNRETIDDTPASGHNTSLQFDAENFAHISYAGGQNDHLKYARQESDTWSIQTIDPTSGSGYFSSLQLDPSGNPHIAYGNNTSTNMGLYYAWSDGKTWNYETIQTDHVAFFVSMAFNSANEPCIAFLDAYENKLRYASRSGGVWTLETIATQNYCGHDCVLVMDLNGNPHIFYACSGLLHSWHNGIQWTHEILNGTLPDAVSALNTPSGIIHVTWTNPSGLYYGNLNNSVWSQELVMADSGNEIFSSCSIAIDGDNNPLITFFESQNRDLLYASKDSGGIWTTEEIDRSDNVGGYARGALDSTGNACVSYTDRVRSHLKFSRQSEGVYSAETIDMDGYVAYTSLTLDEADHAHILYYKVTDSGTIPCLQYANDTTGTWHSQTIETHAGQSCTSATDSNGDLHATYYTSTGDLKYAYKDGVDWISEIILNQVGFSGNALSLAIDNDGYPHISFLNPQIPIYGSVAYAFKDADGWHITPTFDPEPDTGRQSAIALNSSGHPRIVYSRRGAENNLRYAEWDGSEWHIQTLAQSPHYGTDIYLSISIDSSDYSHIVYQTRGIFVYMHQFGQGWQVSDGIWCGSEYMNIVLDVDEKPVVFFHDDTTWDMKVARYGSGTAPTATPSSPASPTSTQTPTPFGTATPTVPNTSTPTFTMTPTPFPTGSGTVTPSQTPTRTPTQPTFTPTPVQPTFTPTPIQPTSTPTPTQPNATPTPDECTSTGVTIIMPQTLFAAGDICWCQAKVCNTDGATLSGYPLFVILDVYGSLFWAPSFNTVFDNYLVLHPEFSTGKTIVQVLPEFPWPAGTGAASGILWYGALTNPDISDIYGNYSVFSFGWN